MSDLSEQLSLDGFGPEPSGRDRLFFAVLPEEPAAQAAAALARQLAGPGDTCVRLEHLHVTLHHLGDHLGVPTAVVQMAERAARAAATAARPFDVCFDQVQRFDRHGRKAATVLTGHAGASAVRSFQVALAAEMKRAGLGQWVEKSFTPHMTLLYGHHGVAPRSADAVHWQVRELALVHSFIGETRHEVLGRWSIRG